MLKKNKQLASVLFFSALSLSLLIILLVASKTPAPGLTSRADHGGPIIPDPLPITITVEDMRTELSALPDEEYNELFQKQKKSVLGAWQCFEKGEKIDLANLPEIMRADCMTSVGGGRPVTNTTLPGKLEIKFNVGDGRNPENWVQCTLENNYIAVAPEYYFNGKRIVNRKVGRGANNLSDAMFPVRPYNYGDITFNYGEYYVYRYSKFIVCKDVPYYTNAHQPNRDDKAFGRIARIRLNGEELQQFSPPGDGLSGPKASYPFIPLDIYDATSIASEALNPNYIFDYKTPEEVKETILRNATSKYYDESDTKGLRWLYNYKGPLNIYDLGISQVLNYISVSPSDDPYKNSIRSDVEICAIPWARWDRAPKDITYNIIVNMETGGWSGRYYLPDFSCKKPKGEDGVEKREIVIPDFIVVGYRCNETSVGYSSRCHVFTTNWDWTKKSSWRNFVMQIGDAPPPEKCESMQGTRLLCTVKPDKAGLQPLYILPQGSKTERYKVGEVFVYPENVMSYTPHHSEMYKLYENFDMGRGPHPANCRKNNNNTMDCAVGPFDPKFTKLAERFFMHLDFYYTIPPNNYLDSYKHISQKCGFYKHYAYCIDIPITTDYNYTISWPLLTGFTDNNVGDVPDLYKKLSYKKLNRDGICTSNCPLTREEMEANLSYDKEYYDTFNPNGPAFSPPPQYTEDGQPVGGTASNVSSVSSVSSSSRSNSSAPAQTYSRATSSSSTSSTSASAVDDPFPTVHVPSPVPLQLEATPTPTTRKPKEIWNGVFSLDFWKGVIQGFFGGSSRSLPETDKVYR